MQGPDTYYYFINNNQFINFEDPEPNYYFVKKVIFILTMLGL